MWPGRGSAGRHGAHGPPVRARVAALGILGGDCDSGGRVVRTGQVGAAHPDHYQCYQDGGQHDHGRDGEAAGDAAGERAVQDRHGYLPGGAQRRHWVPGLGRRGRGVRHLGVGAGSHASPDDGAERGQADRSADLLAGVQQARGKPGVLVPYAGNADQEQRHEDQAQAGDRDEHRAKEAVDVGAVVGDPGEPVEPAGAEQPAGEHQRPGADPGDQLRRDRRDHRDARGEREERDAGLERSIAEHLLYEDRQEEEDAEQCGPHHQRRQVRAGAGAAGQDAQRHQGVLAPPFDQHERREQDRRCGQRGDDLGVAPVRDAGLVGARVGQAVYQGGDAGGAGDRAGQVQPAAAALGLGQDPWRGEGGENPDRHVHEHHPSPRQVAGQQPAADQPDREPRPAHRRVHGHRPVARLALREVRSDQGQRGRCDDRRAGTLDRPGRQKPRL